MAYKRSFEINFKGSNLAVELLAVGEIAALLVVAVVDAVVATVEAAVELVAEAPVEEFAAAAEASALRALFVSLRWEHQLRQHFECRPAICNRFNGRNSELTWKEFDDLPS